MKCVICGAESKLFYKNLYDDRYGAPGFYSVYKCRKCGFGRIYPVLKRGEIGNFYKKYYPLSLMSASDVKKSVNIFPTFLLWVAGINITAHRYIKPDSDVLDVGSGSGASLLEIKKEGSDAWGVEPDPNAQKIAKELGLKVFKGFLTDNPFPDKKFNFVTASQVLEHEPDPLKFLISAKKKLKSGGQIILAFPNFDSIYRKIFGRLWLNWHVPYHINFFTKNSLERLSKKAGLKIVGYRTITPNIWTVFQIRRLFTKTKVGEKSSLWTENKSSGLTKVINIILFILVTPIDRMVDAIGLGDGILVILENVK